MPHPIAKAQAVAYVLDNTRIDVNARDYYIGLHSWEPPDRRNDESKSGGRGFCSASSGAPG
jgi:hypothetical protein